MPLPPTPTFHPLADPAAIVRAPQVRFSVLTGRLIRIEFSPNQAYEERPSQVFWHRQQPAPAFSQKVTPRLVEIETEYLLLRYRITPLGLSPLTLSIRLKQTGRTWRYGASAARSGNLKGTARTLDGVAGATRLEDGLLSRAGWALVDDSTSLVFNDIGWLEPRRASRRQKDLYFFGYATDYAACLGDFTRLAGPIPMIPRYILGNWWSRYWPYSQDELQALMEEFRFHETPLSVCIVDMDWHITRTGNRSSGWTGYTWNRELFPDPDGFIAWLHGQGLRTALNLHPALGVHPHEAQYEGMARRMGIDPASQKPVPFEISDPRFAAAYFELLHHPEEARGVDFWWLDWQQGRKSLVPGLDPLWWLNHLHFQDLGRDGRKRPFIFSRWGGLGNHRYPIGFSGDTFVRWASLAFQPRFTALAANVGYGWWSHDIGGHMFKDQSPELYLRWVQFGVFSPIFRLHSTNKAGLERRPWGKPARIFQAAREAMQLRHALIPYLYSMAWRAHRIGLSLVTPMYYGYPHQPAAYEARDQYFFGSELLVAPITSPADPKDGLGRKRVWFPPGHWTHFFSGQAAPGDAPGAETDGAWHTIEAKLEDIPVYARAGAIVPLAPKVAWGGLENPAALDIYIFPGADNRFELYEDDGETTAYLRGRFAITAFSLQGSDFTIHAAEGDLELIPAQRVYRLHLRGVSPRLRASHPGAYDQAARTFSLEPVTLAARESFTVHFNLS